MTQYYRIRDRKRKRAKRLSQQEGFYDDDFDENELEEERLMTIEGELRALIAANAAAIKGEGDRRATLAATVSSNLANLMDLGTDIVTMRGNIATLTSRLTAIDSNDELIEFSGIQGGGSSGSFVTVGTRSLRNYHSVTYASSRPIWLWQDYPSSGGNRLARSDRLNLISRDVNGRSGSTLNLPGTSSINDLAIGIELFNVDVGSATTASAIATKLFSTAALRDKLGFAIAKYFVEHEDELEVRADPGYSNQITNLQSVAEDMVKLVGSETWRVYPASGITYQMDGGVAQSKAFGTLLIFIDVSASGMIRLISTGHRAIRLFVIGD